MPRKPSTTTIEIPTKLLKALMRSDAMELSIVNAEQTAGVTDSPLQREWQSIADQLSALSHLLFIAHNKTKRRKANKADILSLLNAVFGERNASHVYGVFGFALLASTLNNPSKSGDLVVDGSWTEANEAKWYRLAAERGLGFCNALGGAL